jgi:hypothetical protein
MKRLHVHASLDELALSALFDRPPFATEPSEHGDV